MTSQNCVAHPGVAATFQCDGCGRLLCSACVEQGHRLLFSRHCRERALPLDASLPAALAAAGRDGVGTVLLTYAVLAASRLLGFALHGFPCSAARSPPRWPPTAPSPAPTWWA